MDAERRCSICSKPIADGEGLTFSIPSSGSSRIDVGLYDSERCRTAALAVGAILDAPVGASSAFREQRERIADGLLEAWRRGDGPDPDDVLFAAEWARQTAAVV